jgi:Flp pilus assembly protein TadD
MQGRFEKARTDYRQALAFSPDYTDAEEALRRIQQKK